MLRNLPWKRREVHPEKRTGAGRCPARKPRGGGLVSDTGPGIKKENLTTIFEKFHQESFKHSNHIKGTGLGLAIVKHVVTAHGGRVWAESEPGQGSSFFCVAV